MEVRVLPVGDNIGDEEKGVGSIVDILAFRPASSFAVDVSGTCPAAPTYRTSASANPLSAAKRRAAHKHRLYDAPCRALHHQFIPFVFESTGALHEEAIKLLQDVSAAIASAEGSTFRAVYDRCVNELMSIIISGYTKVFQRGLTSARVANQRGLPRPYIARQNTTVPNSARRSSVHSSLFTRANVGVRSFLGNFSRNCSRMGSRRNNLAPAARRSSCGRSVARREGYTGRRRWGPGASDTF